MCTVSFFPTANGFILTSNRDEQASRPTLPPEPVEIKGQKVYFPKDEKAGGSWIAAGEGGHFACLLNGAFKPHQRKSSYARSRGLILLESFEYNDHNEFVNMVDLEGVEPFTLLLIDYNGKSKLNVLRWDEQKKWLETLELKKPQLWSSALLYSKEIRQKREEIFNEWIKNNPNWTPKQVRQFHLSSNGLGLENDWIMKLGNILSTVSSTQVILDGNDIQLIYNDLVKNKITQVSFPQRDPLK